MVLLVDKIANVHCGRNISLCLYLEPSPLIKLHIWLVFFLVVSIDVSCILKISWISYLIFLFSFVLFEEWINCLVAFFWYRIQTKKKRGGKDGKRATCQIEEKNMAKGLYIFNFNHYIMSYSFIITHLNDQQKPRNFNNLI